MKLASCAFGILLSIVAIMITVGFEDVAGIIIETLSISLSQTLERDMVVCGS